MTLVLHFLILVPVAFFVMCAYSAPGASTAQEVLKAAIPRAVRLVLFTIGLVVFMALFESLFLP